MATLVTMTGSAPSPVGGDAARPTPPHPTPPPPTPPDLLAHLCAFVVLQRPDGHILLARRSGVTYGDGLWGLPGGHAEAGESWLAAAVRETREEIGVDVRAGDLEPVGVQRYMDGVMHGVDVFFRAARWAGDPAPLSECSQVGWFAPGALPADSLDWLAGVLDLHLTRRVWFGEVGFPPA
jgi:8-oxo-dGTP diphosphatase